MKTIFILSFLLGGLLYGQDHSQLIIKLHGKADLDETQIELENLATKEVAKLNLKQKEHSFKLKSSTQYNIRLIYQGKVQKDIKINSDGMPESEPFDLYVDMFCSPKKINWKTTKAELNYCTKNEQFIVHHFE